MVEAMQGKNRWKFLLYLCLGAYIIFIALSMHHFMEMMDFIHQHPVQISRETREMKTRVLEMQNTLPGLLSTPSLTYNDVEEVLQRQDAAQDLSFKKLSSLMTNNLQMLETLKNAINRIRILRREYASELVGNSNYNRAMALYKTKVAPQVKRVYAALDDIFKDSEIQTMEIQKDMNRNTNIAILLSLAIGTLITVALVYADRREAEKVREIAYREKLFNQLSQNVDEVFIIAANDKSFSYVSPNSQRIFGISAEKIQENPAYLYDLLPEHIARWLSDAIKRNDIKTDNQEIDFDLHDVGKYYNIHIFPINDKGGSTKGERHIIVLSDQTRVHMQKQNLQDALDAANLASEAKSSFLSHMSHEIRTPMNAIIGMTTIALCRLADSERVKDCLEKISDSSKHLLGLINDVLDMSKIESGKLAINREVFNLNRTIQNVNNLVRPQTKQKSLNFEILLENVDQEDLIGDGLRLNQILINILSNSIKFTKEGGSVCLKIIQLPIKQNIVRFRFIISDTGIGMSKEFLKRLYLPFEQASVSTTAKYGGTGLGMPITHNLVKLMGGMINVESEEGKGTISTIELPFTLSEHSKPNQNSLPPLKILVVDDDAGTCEHASLLLEKMGLKVMTTLTGIEAVRLAKKAHDSGEGFDVCLIDWKMPDMDGAETAKRIRETIGDDVLIIIISAYDWTPIEHEARQAGVNDFIAKPFFASSLHDTLLSATAPLNNHHGSVEKTTKQYDFGGKRILLVEDNEFNREIGQEFLEMVHAEVDNAENGQEAVDKVLKSPAGYYDLVLMDVQMPIMNGHDATREIRASNHPDAARLPIIAMTANAFMEDITLAETAGMNGHLAKPIDINKLYKTIDKWIK